MKWRPIETGPMDTPVAVMDSRGEIFTARYCTKQKAWIDQRSDEWPEYELKCWHPLPLPQLGFTPPVVKDSLTPAPPTDEELDAIQAEDAYAAAGAHAYSCAKAEAEAALAQLSMDDDLDEPLGPACSRDNPECESCQ